VYFEKYVKGRHGQSLWIRNLQLSIYGVPLAVAYTYMRDGRHAGCARCPEHVTDERVAAFAVSLSSERARRSSDPCVSDVRTARGTAAHHSRASTCTVLHARVAAARLCHQCAQCRSTGCLCARPQGQPRARCARGGKGVRCEEGPHCAAPCLTGRPLDTFARAAGPCLRAGCCRASTGWHGRWSACRWPPAPARQLRMAPRGDMHTAMNKRLRRDAKHSLILCESCVTEQEHPATGAGSGRLRRTAGERATAAPRRCLAA